MDVENRQRDIPVGPSGDFGSRLRGQNHCTTTRNPPSLPDTQKYEIFTHQEYIPVRTNIDIDDHLMRQAMRRSGARSKKAAVEAGLRLLAETHAQGSMRRFRGKVRWQGNLEQSRAGRMPE